MSAPQSDARLRGRVLLVARAAWILAALMVVVIFVAGEFLYMQELHSPRLAVAEAVGGEGDR